MALSTHWVNHIEAWQHTGLRQSVYCREQNLNYNTFSARLSDYRKAQTQTLPTLIPARIVDAGQLCLHYIVTFSVINSWRGAPTCRV